MQYPIPIKLLDTPALLVNLVKLEQNIQRMAEFAKIQGIKLRPHIKSHKIPEIAVKQLKAGAVGITVAKIGEAEVMAAHGIKDIFIANEIIGEEKIARLEKLLSSIKLKVAVDSVTGAELLNDAGKKSHSQIGVLIEINSGLNRAGVLPGQEVLRLAREIIRFPYLQLDGIMTHAGHVYGADSARVPEIGWDEGNVMIRTAKLMRDNGIDVKEVSVGSTPTVFYSGKVKGVTEIRPGNYVFYDAIQVGLGVADVEDCSLTVLATVISKPSATRVVTDAGSKTLALDQGAHGNAVVKGFGIIKGQPNLCITRLSEEHGIIEGSIDDLKNVKIGDKLEIVPNHACPVLNLADTVYCVENGLVIGNWQVAARGKTR